MATYLFSWNPSRFHWDGFAEDAEVMKGDGTLEWTWSCGNTKHIRPGDRAFIIKLGKEAPKGIFASGIVLSHPYEDVHWDEEKAREGKTALFVDVQIDVLLNPYKDEILAYSILERPPFDKMHWSIRKSGARIPDEIADELERVWSRFADERKDFRLPDEVDEIATYAEGAVKKIQVNSYERNAQARQRCIEHYGARCIVCGFNFREVYGEIGDGFIHVHHLRELSEIGEEYEVDPVRDLVPVCPNCHAMIHRRKPAYTVEEIKDLIRRAKENEG